MDFLFDFNKACMNEESHRLTDVSATQGDKQGRAGGRKEGGGRERGREVGERLGGGKEEECVCVFLAQRLLFRSTELWQAVSGQTNPPQKRKKKNTFSFSTSLCLTSGK